MKRSNGEGSILKLKGCRFWYAQYYSNGRQIRISTKTEVRAEALAFLRKLMADRDNGLAPATDVRKVKYEDLRTLLLDSYTAQGRKSLMTRANGDETIPGLKACDEFFKDMRAVQITPDTVRRFVASRRHEVGNAAINRSLACLRRMLNLAKRDGKIRDVPYIEFQKEPPARKGFLELEKFEELLRLLPTHLRPLVVFLYYCGVRIGEALQIEWSQVNLDARLIRLEAEQTKTSEARVLPLPSVLMNMLFDVPEIERTGRVFDGTNLKKSWVKSCVLAGLGTLTKVEGRPYDPHYSGLTLHDLRRSAVRNLVNAGVREKVAMQITGHKTRSVFDRYHIVSTEDVTSAMQAVETATLTSGKRKTLPA